MNVPSETSVVYFDKEIPFRKMRINFSSNEINGVPNRIPRAGTIVLGLVGERSRLSHGVNLFDAPWNLGGEASLEDVLEKVFSFLNQNFGIRDEEIGALLQITQIKR